MNYDYYLKRCIELAKKGEGFVAPNPLVGSIVLDACGDVVGEGYHQKYGEAHAEVNALNMAGENTIGGTLFVSLEPCSHWGKTPPCADLIIERGIKKVVIGVTDPNPKVSGQGIKKLENAGIEVITDILDDECKKLNEIFIKNQINKKTFIAMKSAITMDGKIATKTGSSKWITSEKSRAEVQRLRNKYDAILTGSGTVIADNPSLTCRMEGMRNPIRIIIDSQLKTNPRSKVYNNDSIKVFIAVKEDITNEQTKNFPKNVNFIKCPLKNNKINLNYLTKELYKKGITSILLEAGGILNGAILKENLIDKVYLFMAPKILGDNNGKSFVDGFDINHINKCFNLTFDEIKYYPPDVMLVGYF